VAGINHVAFFMQFEKNLGGDKWQDLYPELRKRHLAGEIPKENPLMPECPNHVRYEMMHQLGYPLDEYPKRCERQVEEWNEQFEKLQRGEEVVIEHSREYAASIMDAKLGGDNAEIYANVTNDGAISGLPDDCIVEVPCTVSAKGVTPQKVGTMPPQLTAMMRTNVNVQELTVRALLEENREHIFHAAMFDPHTAAELDLKQIRAMTQELLTAHRDWLPAWTQ